MFKMFDEILPWACQRFKVTNTGKIFDLITNTEILPFLKDGHYYVNIAWVCGVRDYLVATLVLVTYNKIKIPDILLVDEVIPLYIDNNNFNLSPVNLLYKFKSGALETLEYENFYYIPFYNGYAINKNGDIINLVTGKSKVWTVSQPVKGNPNNKTSGYLYTRVSTDEGISKVLFQHRAVALVFIPYENNVQFIIVNHIDGIPGNNVLSNLEWSTHSSNNKHAIDTGLRESLKSVIVKNLKTGDETKYVSLSECARQLGLSGASAVKKRIDAGLDKVYADMLLFKLDDSKLWPNIDINKIDIYRNGTGSDMVAKNIFTGDTIIFNGINEGCRLTGVAPSVILRHVKGSLIIPTKGYNFRYLDFSDEWPNHSWKHLKIYEENPMFPSDGVELINKDSGELVEFFTSVTKCCQKFKVSKQLLHYFIDKKSVFKEKYLVNIFKLKESYGPIVE